MILTLDVGNSQVYGGVFKHDEMLLRFRRNSKQGYSTDEIGIFLRSVLRENNLEPEKINKISICSVVPDMIYSLRGACKKYFNIDPFILQAGVRTGLKIKYRNPLEVGADRIANAIAATQIFPDHNLVVVDMGTATTFDVITKDKEYLGGAIIAGLRLCMEALESKTAKLPSVEIVGSKNALGRSTVESIQSGLYYGHIGQIKELCAQLSKESFGDANFKIVGTGGFAHLFEAQKLFHAIIPDLVLQGLLISQNLNEEFGVK